LTCGAGWEGAWLAWPVCEAKEVWPPVLGGARGTLGGCEAAAPLEPPPCDPAVAGPVGFGWGGVMSALTTPAAEIGTGFGTG
jgi:hypothetical protein